MSIQRESKMDRVNPNGGVGVHVAQILIDLKNPDPTGRTAEEAIRTLLGFGDRLLDLRRREFHELLCRPAADTDLAADPLGEILLRYLQATALLWNSNKQRAWLRVRKTDGDLEMWEALPGVPCGSAAFGTPALEDPAFDHVMVWKRGHRDAPEDIGSAMAGWSILAEGSCELYSLLWSETAEPAERIAWTEAVSTTRSRGSGLLVNPHYQEHRIIHGPVPVPFWASGENSHRHAGVAKGLAT